MTFRDLFSLCVFGHQSDPVMVVHQGKMRFECRRCQQVIHVPLAKQKLKVRKTKGKILTLRSRRSMPSAR